MRRKRPKDITPIYSHFPSLIWTACQKCKDQVLREKMWRYVTGPFHTDYVTGITGVNKYVCRLCCPTKESVRDFLKEEAESKLPPPPPLPPSKRTLREDVKPPKGSVPRKPTPPPPSPSKRYGNYISWPCCTSCEHYEPNLFTQELRAKMVLPTRNICPKCGEGITNRTGRWIIETIPKRWFWQTTKTKYVEFARRYELNELEDAVLPETDWERE